MKLLITPSYTFTPGISGSGTVNLSGIGSFDVKHLVAIINQTKGNVIYSTGSVALRYTNVTGTTLTLFCDTSLMSNTDTLQVIYDDQTYSQPVTNASFANLDVALSTVAKDATVLATNVLQGAINETAPASDTASSGLNGRLQRLAQRITSLISLFPTALGQGTMATSLKVVLPSDQTAIPVTNANLDVALSTVAKDATVLATNVLQGALTESAPASDTASSGLNGRLQRLAQRITSLISLFPTALGQGTMATSLKVVLPSDQSAIPVVGSTFVGTPSNAKITVGTSQVRATVSGSAPNAARKKLVIKPTRGNTGIVYYGATGLSTANGMEIVGVDAITILGDASDYFLIADTVGQSVEIIEVV